MLWKIPIFGGIFTFKQIFVNFSRKSLLTIATHIPTLGVLVIVTLIRQPALWFLLILAETFLVPVFEPRQFYKSLSWKFDFITSEVWHVV